MLFWISAALLTLGASLAVLLPLADGSRRGSTGAGHDVEVYKDQLKELDRDAARGLIQPAEAEEARAEIGRRILSSATDTASVATSQSRVTSPGRLAGMIAVLAVPLVSWGLYGYLGSPDLPGQPLQARLAADPSKSSIDELVARAEAHLAANPDDGRGWAVLAPVYLRMGRIEDARTAYTAAIRIEGATAEREAGLGEAIASAAGGIVSAEAQAAFERAIALEPDYPKARFFLGTAMAQEGRFDAAIASWRSMLRKLPVESPWHGVVAQSITEAQKRLTEAEEPQARPGPTQDDLAAAQSMSPADRTAMIETMVASLDEKLRQNPEDSEGWRRLVRSYIVLGKQDIARDALERGIAALGAESPEAAGLSEFAAALGLKGRE